MAKKTDKDENVVSDEFATIAGFTAEWEKFEKNYSKFEQLLRAKDSEEEAQNDGDYEGSSLRWLRIFNLKFRISLDLITDFKAIYSRTRDPNVRNAYIELFGLLQFWNSYEGLIKLRNSLISEESH